MLLLRGRSIELSLSLSRVRIIRRLQPYRAARSWRISCKERDTHEQSKMDKTIRSKPTRKHSISRCGFNGGDSGALRSCDRPGFLLRGSKRSATKRGCGRAGRSNVLVKVGLHLHHVWMFWFSNWSDECGN